MAALKNLLMWVSNEIKLLYADHFVKLCTELVAWFQVCYSWWVLSSLIMIDRVHWIDKEKLIKFILDCQVL